MKAATAVLTLLFAASCANLARTDAAPPAQSSQFKNLQVLPPGIPREQLIETMRGFSRGLGVKCDHCHVVTATEPEPVLDFPSDAKEEKRAARVMLQMVQQINGSWLERVEAAEGHLEEERTEDADEGAAELRVVCWTCHRGNPEPAAPPPPEPRA
jgi:hypothetical protein